MCKLMPSFVLALLLTAVPTMADSITFDNPVVQQRADPFITLHTDGYYYFVASVPEYDRIEVRRAQTIQALGQAKPAVVWRKHSHGEMGAHIWAPEIHWIDGKWYIYFAAGGAKDIWAIRIYVLENASANPLEGKWEEKGQLKTNWESFALDSTTFDQNGRRYLLWAQAAPPTPGTNIYIAEMDSPNSITGKQVLLTKPEFDWEKRRFNVNEGPAILKKNGRIFMAYSASGTDANYCMGLLTAREDANLLDPASWTKSPKPVLATNKKNKVFGPGHCSFTTTVDGKEDLLVYHARNYEEIVGDPLYDPNRHTRVQVIKWNADGTPDFGEPVADSDKVKIVNLSSLKH